MTTWLPIPDFPDYKVSDAGEVMSHKYRSPRILRQTVNPKTGYPTVTLHRDGKAHTWTIHLLVLLAFVGPRPEGAEHSRHLNGDRLDNHLSNLAYGTRSQNMLDAVAHGAHANARLTECVNGHPFTAENTYRRPSNPTKRDCRTCTYDSHRRAIERRQMEPAA